MPKTKTRSAAKKRLRLTGSGKLLRRHAMQSHNLGKKSSKRKRAFRQAHDVSPADTRAVRKLFGRKAVD